MAVVASFTADIIGGESPLTVQFTDTSTGSPNTWLWDFGDGTFSEDQHPEHIYDADIGESFTVILKAFIVLANTSLGAIDKFEHLQKSGINHPTPEAAYAKLTGNPWSGPHASVSTLDVYYYSDGVNTDEDPKYSAVIVQPKANLSLPAPSGAGPSIFSLRAVVNGQVTLYEPGLTITSNHGGSYLAGGNNVFFLDVTALDGIDIEFIPTIRLIETIPPQAPWARAGVSMNAILFEQTTNSANDFDSETKVNFITIGTAPVANFYASPTKGRNPLFTSFVNTSTLAIGAATSYVWKKRVSGSGAAFQTFSTTDNPVHLFDRDSP